MKIESCKIDVGIIKVIRKYVKDKVIIESDSIWFY